MLIYIGSTALMYAAARSHDKVVSLLIEKGADMDLQSIYGESALIILIFDTLYIISYYTNI